MRCLLCNARFIVTVEGTQVKCNCAVQVCDGCDNSVCSCISAFTQQQCPWCKTRTEWYIVPPGFFSEVYKEEAVCVRRHYDRHVLWSSLYTRLRKLWQGPQVLENRPIAFSSWRTSISHVLKVTLLVVFTGAIVKRQQFPKRSLASRKDYVPRRRAWQYVSKHERFASLINFRRFARYRVFAKREHAIY